MLPRLAGEVVDFVTFVADLLGPARTSRSAVLADLGGRAGRDHETLVLPEAPLAAITAVPRRRSTPTCRRTSRRLGNLALLLGAVIDQIEAWEGTDWAGRGDTLRQQPARPAGQHLRPAPLAQAVPGHAGGGRSRRSSPGRWRRGSRRHDPVPPRVRHDLLVRLEPRADPRRPGRHAAGRRGQHPEHHRDTSFLVVDGLIRGIVAAIAVVDQTQGRVRRQRARRRDRRLGRRRARRGLAGAPDGGRRPVGPDGLARAAARRRHRRRAAAGQLAVPAPAARHPGPPAPAVPRARRRRSRSTRCSTRAADGRPDVALPGRHPQRRRRGAADRRRGGLQANADAATVRRCRSAGRAVPDETGISYALPRATGTRLELGRDRRGAHAVAAPGARVLLRLDHCALVIDSADKDSFMRKLLGGRPIRKAVLPRPGLRRQARLHPRGARRRRPSTRPGPSRRSTPRVRPVRPTLEMTLPLGGGGLLGINVHEVVLRLAGAAGRRRRRPAGRWRSARWSRSARSSARCTSASTGSGLFAAVDTMTPSGGAQPAASSRPTWTRPARRGIALDLRDRTGQRRRHDPARPGHRRLRRRARPAVGKRVTITCIGLASTKDREGNDAVVAHPHRHGRAPRPAGRLRHLRRLRPPLRRRPHASTWPPSARPCRPASCKHILFPADPVKHLPELVARPAHVLPAAARAPTSTASWSS